jgi:hypothetical protein
MPRRVFISYQHEDQLKAKGFNLLRWNKNVDVEFVGRHLLDPVNSQNSDYITRKIKEQLKGTSVTVVLIGQRTADSEWVDKEIQWGLEKERPNGVIGIRLDPDVEIPRDLKGCGAEILNWYEPADTAECGPAIERAALAAGRKAAMSSSSSGGCGR